MLSVSNNYSISFWLQQISKHNRKQTKIYDFIVIYRIRKSNQFYIIESRQKQSIALFFPPKEKKDNISKPTELLDKNSFFLYSCFEPKKHESNGDSDKNQSRNNCSNLENLSDGIASGSEGAAFLALRCLLQ